jgi:hypothetical protein
MIGYRDKINQILRGAETVNKAKDNDIDLELSVSVLTKTLEKVQLERDALWVKTQEDEREINQLRDAVIEKKRQRDKAIELVKELMPFVAFDLDNDRFGLITDLQTRFEELMLEVS